MNSITQQRTVELIFPPDFDIRAEYEAEQRGLLDYVKAQVDGMKIYSICFFTAQRIQVELNLLVQAGQSWFAEPGLIVIPAVTRSAMQNAITYLAATDYFDHIVPDA